MTNQTTYFTSVCNVCEIVRQHMNHSVERFNVSMSSYEEQVRALEKAGWWWYGDVCICPKCLCVSREVNDLQFKFEKRATSGASACDQALIALIEGKESDNGQAVLGKEVSHE